MLSLKDFFRRKPDIPALRRKIEQVDAALAAAIAQRDASSTGLRDLYVTGTDAEIEAGHQRLQGLERDVERLRVQGQALRERLETAEANAARVQELAELDAAAAASAEAARILETEYLPHARALADILSRLRDLDGTVVAALDRLNSGGFPHLAPSDTEARPLLTAAQRTAPPRQGGIILYPPPVYGAAFLPHPHRLGGGLAGDGHPHIWEAGRSEVEALADAATRARHIAEEDALRRAELAAIDDPAARVRAEEAERRHKTLEDQATEARFRRAFRGEGGRS